jgi:hypothetical protein
MHLGQLELRLGSCSGGEAQIADYVPQSLSVVPNQLAQYRQSQGDASDRLSFHEDAES